MMGKYFDFDIYKNNQTNFYHTEQHVSIKNDKMTSFFYGQALFLTSLP